MPRKRTDTENDLMEIEAALAIAAAGGSVFYASAENALTRLFQRYATTLPKNYKASIIQRPTNHRISQ
jgi:hypothetical protein